DQMCWLPFNNSGRCGPRSLPERLQLTKPLCYCATLGADVRRVSAREKARTGQSSLRQAVNAGVTWSILRVGQVNQRHGCTYACFFAVFAAPQSEPGLARSG